MSRFFADPSQIGDSRALIIDKDDIKHIKNVLRMKNGDNLTLSDSDSWEYECEIEEISSDEVSLKILDKQKFASEPGVKVTLFQGVPKGSKLDDVVRKTTEMGISAIVPVFMERSVVKDNGSYQKKVSRFRSIADEASKQSGRGIIPNIHDSCSFDKMMLMLQSFDLVIFPYENEDENTIKDAMRSLSPKPDTVAVIIGPEGGFSDKEACMIKKTSAHTVSLGKSILRTETAGIVALAMIMYELEL